MESYEGGATRTSSEGKPDYEGYFSFPVVEVYGEYMLAHQQTEDGMRGSDNWQAGIPKERYMKSLVRHLIDLWALHRGYKRYDRDDGHELTKKEMCCAVMFNVMGYLHEDLRYKAPYFEDVEDYDE